MHARRNGAVQYCTVSSVTYCDIGEPDRIVVMRHDARNLMISGLSRRSTRERGARGRVRCTRLQKYAEFVPWVAELDKEGGARYDEGAYPRRSCWIFRIFFLGIERAKLSARCAGESLRLKCERIHTVLPQLGVSYLVGRTSAYLAHRLGARATRT